MSMPAGITPTVFIQGEACHVAITRLIPTVERNMSCFMVVKGIT